MCGSPSRIREGKNREVRNVLRHLGLQVARLIRVSFGPFQLGEIAEGEVAEVPTRVLRDQLGEKLAKAAGADFSAPVVERKRRAAEERPPPEPRARSRSAAYAGAANDGKPEEREARTLGEKDCPAARCAAKAAATRSMRATNALPGVRGPPSPASGGTSEPAECASSADGCAGARLRHRSRRRSARPPTGCASRCSTSWCMPMAIRSPARACSTCSPAPARSGFEALSRGAEFAQFVDDGAEARALQRQNVEALGLAAVTRIFRRDATKLGPAHPVEPFSLVFLDPPYGKGLAEKALVVGARRRMADRRRADRGRGSGRCRLQGAGRASTEIERRDYDDTESSVACLKRASLPPE